MSNSLFAFAAVIGFAAAISTAAKQQGKPFDPMPANERELYRFDLKKNFYADDAAWQRDMDGARARIAAIEAYKGRVLESPATLLRVLDAKRGCEDLLEKLYAYGEFTNAVDTKNRKYMDAYQELRAEAGARASFFAVELRSLNSAKLEALLKQEPKLGRYSYVLEAAVRQAPHVLSEKEESLLATLGPALSSWEPALFQLSFDRTAFPEIAASGASRNVHRDYATLLKDPDRAVREKAFHDYYQKLRELSDLAGFALLKEMQANNAVSKLHGFSTYYHEALFNAYLDRPELDNLYSQIEANLPLYHQYLNLKMNRLATDMGVRKVEIWDMDIAPKNSSEPRFTADEGCRIGLQACSVLGDEYTRELGKLLDPKNGRLDIAGGPNRGQGAFCEGNFAYFMDNYQGYLDDVATLVHESGHAIHYQLVLNHQGSLYFGDGPAYMTESFATFNEWLFRDQLLKTLKDDGAKRAVRSHVLDEMMALWEIARRAKFEMVSYDRVASGEITGAKGFDNACEDTGLKYDPFFARYPELDVHWMRKHHYWDVPGYYFNYVLAHVLALTYYQRYLEDPAGFPKKYVAMVSQGFDRPAEALLKDFLNIDLQDPKLLQGVFTIMQKQIKLVEEEGAAAAKR